MEQKSIIKIVIGTVALIAVLLLSTRMFEEVDAGEIVVIQSPFTGNLSVHKEAGYVWQGGGKATHYRKSNQFWFLSDLDKESSGISDSTDNSVAVQWNDGGKA